MSVSKTKVVCILNPQSCDGDSLRRWPEIERYFRELRIDFELVSQDGDLSETVFEILSRRNQEELLIAGVGGDGTHCALINGMLRFKERNPGAVLPPYSVIPFGTGNNIAKSFGLNPKDGLLSSHLRRAAFGTVYGAEYRIDVGRLAGGRYFLDGFAVGVDAHILAGRNRDKDSFRKSLLFGLIRGYPVYFWNVLKSLGKCSPLRGEIEVDGEKFYSGDLFNIIVNNTRIYAGEFDLTDDAFANDGLLDVLVFTGKRDYIWRYFLSHRYLPRKVRRFSSLTKEGFICRRKGKVFNIKLEKPIPALIDGESLSPGNEFTIETFPNAITLRVPVEPE